MQNNNRMKGKHRCTLVIWTRSYITRVSQEATQGKFQKWYRFGFFFFFFFQSSPEWFGRSPRSVPFKRLSYSNRWQIPGWWLESRIHHAALHYRSPSFSQLFTRLTCHVAAQALVNRPDITNRWWSRHRSSACASIERRMHSLFSKREFRSLFLLFQSLPSLGDIRNR